MNTADPYAKGGPSGSVLHTSLHPAPALSPALARALALQSGFSAAGLVALPYANLARDAARFEQWVKAGSSGSMRYLARTGEDGQLVRARVSTPFPWARAAVVCLANYQSAQPLSTEAADPASAWIARYAWSSRPSQSSRTSASGQPQPSDYHKVLLKRLVAMDAQLQAQFGPFESRCYVDTGPVVERSLAVAAGLGWTGKNTCLIHPTVGSFTFLAVLLMALPAEAAAAPLAVPDRCGSCRRCLDACPTGALFEPYHMDATRCISYLTIEHKGEIPAPLMAGMGRQVFGCDICQDVCPWNGKAPIAADPDLVPRTELVNPALEWLAGLEEEDFERHFNGSPVRRAGYLGLLRNVAVAMGNSRLARFAPRLQDWAAAADQGLAAAARWALQQLF